jgi:hypothetical protein
MDAVNAAMNKVLLEKAELAAAAVTAAFAAAAAEKAKLDAAAARVGHCCSVGVFGSVAAVLASPGLLGFLVVVSASGCIVAGLLVVVWVLLC